ncbi:MAG: hypothetical protein GQ477_05815, partial [Nanohaloarchaea archaeon]|nr:hypothetical protein [Candidatus Nanohaloarchaea archaeon]
DRSLGTVGLNETTYENYYRPDSLTFTGSSVFAPLEQAYQKAATTIYDLLNLVGLSGLYTGDEVTPTVLYSKLDESSGSNVIYFAGGGTNTKLYVNSTEVDILNNDLNKCPFFYSSNDSVECQGKAEFSYFKNRLVFFSTSDYFTRLSSNDTGVSVWDMNNANSSDWVYQESLILNMLSNSQSDGPLAFIGPVSSTWIGTENFAKTFFSNLIFDNDLGSALSTSKNMLRLNKNNIVNQTTKDFISHIDDSYVLYGLPQIESKTAVASLDYNTEKILQIDTNPITDNPISWNLTISISPKFDIGGIYSLGQWNPTKSTVWFYNVTEPSNSKINVSFISALNGDYSPDPSAYNVSVDVNTIQKDITQMTVEIERTKIISSSTSTEQYNQSTNFLSTVQISEDDFKYDFVNNKSLIFAILYSANETLSSSYSKTVNLTFKTEGVSIETLSIKGKDNSGLDIENNITIIFNLVNPTELIISNLTLRYPVPEGVIACNVSGSNLSGLCIDSSGFILQNISQLSSGKTQYTLNYIVSANMTNTKNIYYDSGNEWQNKSIFNWGDNVTIKSDIASLASFDAEIITESIFLRSRDIMDNGSVIENTIVWSNITTVTLVSSSTLIEPIWTIPVNTSSSQPGEYLMKVYVLENTTSKYLLKNIMYVNITDDLDLDVIISNVSSTSINNYISEGQVNLTITGSAKKQSGQPLNGSLIGQDSISVSIGDSEPSVFESVTDNGQLPTITLENLDFNPGLNTITVKVFDEFNNSDTFDYLFNVTNVIDSIIVKVNDSDTFTANEDDFVQIKGTIKDNEKNVFNANVSIYYSETEKICDTKTDESGVYSCDWEVPYGKDKHSYTITVNAVSPLDVDTVVSNFTTLDVLWLDVTIDPAISDIGITSTVNISKDV